MMQRLFELYKNGRYTFDYIIKEQLIEKLKSLPFNPNEQIEATGDTLLHVITERSSLAYFPDIVDEKLLELLLAAGADPTIRNKKNQDMIDVFLASITNCSTIKQQTDKFDYYFSLLQKYSSDITLFTKMLNHIPGNHVPTINYDLLSLEYLKVLSSLLEDQITKIKKEIDNLNYQADYQHPREARETRSLSNKKMTQLVGLRTKTDIMNTKIGLLEKYGEFHAVLINFLMQEDTKLLIRRAMLSGGSFLFFIKNIKEDIEFQHSLINMKTKEIFDAFWEQYEAQKKLLDELHVTMNTFTPEEDKKLSDIFETLFNAHPDHKMMNDANLSFRYHFAQQNGKSLAEVNMEERKAAFIKNEETRTLYQSLQNEFKQCLRINPNKFFGSDGSLTRHKTEETYRPALAQIKK